MGDRVHRVDARTERPHKKKVRLTKKFTWEGTFKSYAASWVFRNHWRVVTMLPENDDAMQEARMVFQKCVNRYQGKVDNAKWMMALYKRALANHWHNVADKTSKIRETETIDTLVGSDGVWQKVNAKWVADVDSLEEKEWHHTSHSEMVLGTTPASNGVVLIEQLLDQASDELRGVIDALLSAPAELIGANTKLLNRRINKMLGFDKIEHDYVADMRAILETKQE